MTDKEEKQEEKESEKEDEKGELTVDKVRELISEALEPIRSAIGGGDSDDGDKKEDDSKDETDKKRERRPLRRSFSMVEEDAKNMVQDAVRTVLGEAEHEKEHIEIKTKTAPQQKAPIKVRRSTRFWLGKGFGQE
jgi:hypothetical protein